MNAQETFKETAAEMKVRHAKQTFDSLTRALEASEGNGLAWICGYLGAGGTTEECCGAIAQAIKEHQARENAAMLKRFAFADDGSVI